MRLRTVGNCVIGKLGNWGSVLFFAFAITQLLNYPITSLAQGIDVDDTGLSTTAENAGYGEAEDLDVVVGDIIEVVMGFLGFVFFAYTLYAGILWMTASGSPDKIKQAKGMITNGIIGLVIVSAAYSIAYFVVSSI